MNDVTYDHNTMGLIHDVLVYISIEFECLGDPRFVLLGIKYAEQTDFSGQIFNSRDKYLEKC